MDEIARRIGALAPAQLEQLDRKIRARGLPLAGTSAAPRDPRSFAQERDQLQGDRLAALLGYWKQALDGAPTMLELPADRRRPTVPSFRGASQPLVVEPEVYHRLARLAHRENVPLATVLLAAFDALLFRYTGQHDIVVGTPIANRDRAGLEPLIGLFASTLVIRTRLHGTLTFRDLVAQVREVTLGAQAHQELPFEKLVEELHPDRTLGHDPVFQVMFALHSAPTPAPLDAHPQITPGLSRFDLTLSMVEHTDGLAGTVEYSTDLFDHATITRMIGHLQTLLAHAAASPDQPLQQLPLLTGAERHEILVTWNTTGADYPAEACVHELVEAQVDRTPDSLAVVFQDRSVIYRQLDERANRLAHRLRSLGVGPEVRVGLCVERSLDMVVGALAILKAGGAYLPLDPTYPPQRLATILEEARVPVLVTTSHSEHVLPRYAARVIRIDHVLHGESHRPARTASPDSLAYVIYSSGSTGTPKGIEVVHRGLCNIATYQARRFGVYRGDRALQFFSLGFDAWLWDVLLALTAGATLYVAPEEIRSSGPALAEFLARHRIHVATLLPSVLAVMPQIPLPDLHTIIAGGEVCSADVVAAWAPGRRFFNVYGPTEASIAATVSRCEADGRRPAIGRPVDNTTAYILDANLAPVPIGVTGELYLGGIGVARGYFERPALTAARFLADPFSDAPGARLCRTGDLARYLPTGEIEILGRIDDQVKVRGMRIELSEIEAVLRRHPAIHEAAVVLRDGPAGLQLAAYLVLASGQLASARELRELLRQTLPAYMVPVTFTFLDQLPRGDTGKIDVRALPEPALLDRTRDPGLVAPRNAAERVVAEIWQHILGVERIGVHDNFFDLGGHSLAATRVLSQIHERWKVDIAVCRFFDAPTVAALAELVAGPCVADPGPSALDELALHGPAALLARVGELSAAEVDALLEMLSGPLEGGDMTPPSRLSILSSAEKRERLARLLQDKARFAKPYPLSFAQERLWFLDQLQPGVPIYNLPAALRLPGPLDVPALERTLTEIVRRHEGLRTTFPAEHGKPVQRIAPAQPVPLPLADLRSLPAEAREAELQRLIAQETHHVFDLARGPLVRALLVRVDDLEHALVLVTHHIVSDGASAGVLLQELTALYAAFAAGRPSPLPELPLQYADHAQQQRDRLQGDRLASLLGYWKRTLDGAPTMLELPTDRRRPAVPSFRGARQTFVLGREVSQQLESLAHREGATLFMVLLAGFDALLFRYTGQRDIVIGTPIANRNRADLEPLIGLFTNTLVIRTRPHGILSFRDLVAQVREVTLGAYAHQELPFEKLVEELHPDQTLSHDPVFQVMFALHGAPHTPRTADLSLSIVEHARGLGGTIEYSTDLFDHATITRMIGHLQTLLAHAAASPRQPLHLLSMLTDAERHQILVTWNDTRADYPDDACVHELVEAQVDRTPDAQAVVFQDQALTYRQLDERANRLAHRLRSLGVGPEVRVGLCVERSLDMVVATLAILKAGGVYLPLDPTQPGDRLAFMLADARAPVLLIQPRLVASVPAGAHHAIALDSAWDEIEGQPDHRLTNLVTPESALAVFYPPGSTAAVGHIRGFVNLFHWYRGVAAIGPGSRVLLMTPFTCDASFKNLMTPLVAGGTVVLADPGDDARAIASTIERERVTTTFTTPGLLDPMLEAAAAHGYAPLTSLETLFIGGESTEVARLRTWLASPGCHCRVIHLHGAPECSDVATSFVPPPRWLANARAYVLDGDGSLLPIGVPGELCVSGMSVGRGYLDRPGLTAERFVPDPFLRGERLYRTGDRARWLASGEIDLLGRIDHPVEIQPAPEAEVDALSQTRK